MFVRWKKRPYAGRYYEAITYSAYLVESKRVNGKPRQKNIGYLGSIRKDTNYMITIGVRWEHHNVFRTNMRQINDQENDRAFVAFYTELRTRMKHLQLAQEQQASIEQQVSKTVPHKTVEQCEACLREEREENTKSYLRSLRA